MLTDNPVLVRRLNPVPALCCAQSKAEKKVAAEEDFITANINSFGNEIGSITNKITSMYEVRAGFDKDSEEYKILSYRIRCGQLYQQNCIDKAKGIISKPMPKTWHDRHAVNKIEEEDQKNLYRRIVADKKPYFMKYIYPALKKEYNTYIKNTDRKALREFGLTVSQIQGVPKDERTKEQEEFLRYYDIYMPVGTNDCVMNRICRRFEEEFNGIAGKLSSETKFDYEIMKSDAEYTVRQYYEIKKIYDTYNSQLQSFKTFASYEKADSYEMSKTIQALNDFFIRECSVVCPNEEALCNIILDLCYRKAGTKKFAWSMCGDVIINNLLKKNNYGVNYPVLDEEGDFTYCGNRFSMASVMIEEETNDSIK